MIYNIFACAEELEGIVNNYTIIHSVEGIDGLVFLPNGCNFIVFNRGLEAYTQTYKEEKKSPVPKGYSVSVKSNQVKKFLLSKDATSSVPIFPIILVELSPIGFYKLFNIDAYSLRKRCLHLDEEMIEKYFKDLYKHNSLEEDLEYLNRSLITLHNSHKSSRICMQDVIEKISSYRFEVTVQTLTEEFGCSRSTMERSFKKTIGLTPKNFIFVSKFCKTVLAYIEDECTFEELTYLYSDNSHLNSIFKKFFGVNPSVIVREVAENKMKIYQMQKLKESR